MSTYQEFIDVQQRYEQFLNKLTERANELAADASSMAQQVYDDDDDRHKRSYGAFVSGIKGQLSQLRDKARQVFDREIYPRRSFPTHHPDYSKMVEAYSEIYDAKNSFDERMYALADEIFEKVQQVTAQEKLNTVLAEYEEIKNDFCCSQCGGDIPIEQLYFVSTYINCPYCQTQNTFVPSTQMRELSFLAKEVGEQKYRKVAAAINRDNEKEWVEVWQYYQYRALVWLEGAQIAPSLKTENALVFYREVLDATRYHPPKDFFKKRENYTRLLEQIAAQDYPVTLNAEEKKQLIDLSIIFIKKLGHFNNYKTVYEKTLHQLHQQKSQL